MLKDKAVIYHYKQFHVINLAKQDEINDDIKHISDRFQPLAILYKKYMIAAK